MSPIRTKAQKYYDDWISNVGVHIREDSTDDSAWYEHRETSGGPSTRPSRITSRVHLTDIKDVLMEIRRFAH